jgi:oleandomycin transport system ATP-binding protein
MNDLVVRAEGLRKRFGKTQALDGVDLAMRRGTVLGVLGPNGAGKTTAVRVLATLLKPDEGTAEVAGVDVLKQPQRVRRRIGLTGQYASVDEDLTGTQNLVLIGQLLDLTTRDARRRAVELLEWFDLSEAAGRPAKTYSGGMRRRLDLAASLVGHPEVIFLDEPTTGLDPAKREDMWGVVRTQITQGASVLLTTQYLEEADALADEIVVINHGKVIAHDTPDGLKRRVGGLTLMVRPADPAMLGEALRVLDAVAAPGTNSSEDTAAGARPGAASVPVANDTAIDAALPALRRAGVEFIELGLHLPSLDEVFHALTEEGLEPAPKKETELV